MIFQDYVDLAKELIGENGYHKAIIRKAVKTSDPNKPWENTTVFEEYSTDIVILPMDKYSRETMRLISERTNVIESSSRAFIPYTGFTPDLTCEIDCKNGRKYRVQNVTEYCPNGEIIMYKLDLV